MITQGEIVMVDTSDIQGSDREQIPEGVFGAIVRYVKYGTHPGSFVEAVLSNDLLRAFQYADAWSIRAMPEIVRYCCNHIPAPAWGSAEKVDQWIAAHNNGGS